MGGDMQFAGGIHCKESRAAATCVNWQIEYHLQYYYYYQLCS